MRSKGGARAADTLDRPQAGSRDMQEGLDIVHRSAFLFPMVFFFLM